MGFFTSFNFVKRLKSFLLFCVFVILSIKSGMFNIHRVISFIAISFTAAVVSAGSDTRHTLNGHIRDFASGEDLFGAAVYISDMSTGTITNHYGFYSISLPEGSYRLEISHIGYKTKYRNVELDSDKTINFDLEREDTFLDEVVITDDKADRRISDVRMSLSQLQMDVVRSLPAFMGEVDILKTLFLLPGVSWATEGSTGFFVRGGGQDQNMVLLDEATVFNASHLLGFFSVFNSDAIKDLQLYKGGIPARYGGRLSSVLDIRMKEGNNKEYSGTGGIGSISSRLTLEGPIQQNISSFIVSGRRTYADLFLPFSTDTTIRKNRLYFYDINAKANYRFSDKNRIFVSGYFGRDVFRFDDIFGFEWGNATTTMRWNHIFNSRLFSNFTFVYSNYDYNMIYNEDIYSIDWVSNISDITLKGDFTWYPNPENTVSFGLHSSYNSIDPGHVKGKFNDSALSDYKIPDNNVLHHALYASNEQLLSTNLTIEYGLRYSLFQNTGKGTVYSFDEDYQVIDTTEYSSGEIFHNHHGFEPRIGVVYRIDSRQSIKASYNRTRQYLHQATNSTSATPLDIWFPSSPNVKPQIADQWTAGYFRNFMDNMLESSVEVYYKNMANQIDFREHAVLILNPQLEGELRTGKAWSYGVEFMVNKSKGDFTGWLSYTWSKTRRKIPAINDGNPYPAPYDRPHDLAIVLSYKLSDRFNIAANWVYNTGRPITMPTGRFEYGGMILPVYSERNAERLPDYHRLDLSLTINTRTSPDRTWQGKWNISVYNAYHHKNVFSYYFRQKDENPYETQAYKIYMFGIIPAVTYNFSF